MRILQFINGMHPGGKERRLVELLKYLRANTDAEVQVVTMSEEMTYPEVLELGIKIHYLIRKTRKDLRIFYSFLRLCREVKPDIVHTWDSMTSVYAVPTVKLLGIRFVNGSVVEAPPTILLFRSAWIRSRFTFAFADAIVSNSYAGLESFRVPRGKGVCVYNGFDSRRADGVEDCATVRKRFHIESPKVVGMVGEFAERKDFESFVLAAQKILHTRDDVTFITVGKGERLEKCISMVEPQYREKVKFLGWQSDVESIVNAMDIGVLATFTEGISNAILEYMGLAKPVVATDGGGTKEIVVDGKTGFLVAGRNVDRLAERICELLDHPHEARMMGVRGKQRVAELFSIETMAARFLDIYGGLLQNRKVLESIQH